MSAFASAVDVLFADPHQATDALWTPKGQGAGVTVRVVRRAPTIETGWAGTQVLTDGNIFGVRVSEVPVARKGDVVEVDGESFKVHAEPKLDRLRLFWTAETTLIP